MENEKKKQNLLQNLFELLINAVYRLILIDVLFWSGL